MTPEQQQAVESLQDARESWAEMDKLALRVKGRDMNPGESLLYTFRFIDLLVKTAIGARDVDAMIKAS